MIGLIATAGLAATRATPLVNWAGLVKVLLLALATAVVIVGGFSLGLAALDVYESGLRRRGEPLAASGAGETAAEAPPAGGIGSLAVALLFFAVCVAGVIAGLVAMVEK